jgi:hypothetical protein
MNILAQPYQEFISSPEPTNSSMIKYIWQLCIFIGIIFLIHHIFEYLKKSFTTPIKTNLVQLYQNKYNEMVDFTNDVTRGIDTHNANRIRSEGSEAGVSVSYSSGLHAIAKQQSRPSEYEPPENTNPEKLSTTQKEYLSRELLDMIHKSI